MQSTMRSRPVSDRSHPPVTAGPQERTTLDAVLIFVFVLFGFVALIFEPLYYFGCRWQGDLCPLSPFLVVRETGKIWNIYCHWDPLFKNVPLWLQVLCCIEVFVFGPLYLVCAFGLKYRRTWLNNIALPFCGALVYSTLVYFAMEILDIQAGTNLPLVFVINIPWTIFPIVLGYRVIETRMMTAKHE
jgi:hypothetical protein